MPRTEPLIRLNEYRCTRLMCYPLGHDQDAMQGHFIQASGTASAYAKMCHKFPEDLDRWRASPRYERYEPFGMKLHKRFVNKPQDPAPSDDRVIHYTGSAEERVAVCRAVCREEDWEHKLDEALEYVRTFSKGSEKDGWKSGLAPDFGANQFNFVATISRNGKHYMTIGMIRHGNDKEWCFHS